VLCSNLSLVVSDKEQALSIKSVANGYWFFMVVPCCTVGHVSGQLVLQHLILADEKLMLSDFHDGKISPGSLDAWDDFLLHVQVIPLGNKFLYQELFCPELEQNMRSKGLGSCIL